MKKNVLVICMFLLFLIAASASADTINFDLTVGNSSVPPFLSSFPPPYATVTVNRTSSTTAAITFTGLTGTNPSPPPTTVDYLLGGNSAVNLNVNATTFTVGSIGSTNLSGFTPGPFTVGNPPGTQNVSDFGLFNMTMDDFDGNTHSVLTISFTLTDTSGTWASASDVLIDNNKGFLAAAHIFVSTGDASDDNLTTGFAGNGTPGTPVPEPATMFLLGSGLIGLAGLARRKLKK